MIQLGRHIEILLLDNDCVIVPDFGGFVAHHVSARYDQDDHIWLPPMRTLGFNPQLRINDSLLAQSYVNAYNISYPEALRRIEDETNELRQELDSKGSYELADIGMLSINSNGNIQFSPCEAGILSPEFYGLGGCEFLTMKETLKESLKESAKTVTIDEEAPKLIEFIDNHNDDDDRAIQIKMSWVRNAVAVAAAIVAFFIMATPIANSDLNTSSMSQLQHRVFQRLMPQDTNMTKATPVAVVKEKVENTDTFKTTKNAEMTEMAKTEEPAKAEEATKPTEHTPGYCIVLASQVKRSNADYYVEQLHKQGYKEAQVYVHNNTVRVIYGAYETEAEAYRQLNRMTSKEEFADAWVYQMKGKS